MGTVDGPPLPLHTAGSFPTLLVERWRSVCAVNKRRGKAAKRKSSRGSQNNLSKTEPSSPWLVLNDLFQQWRGRLESSQEAADKLEALLRNRETRSAFVSASGEVPPGWVSWLSSGSASLVVLSYFYAGASELARAA